MVGSPHAVAFFSSRQEFLDEAVPFVEEGLDHGDAVWVWAAPECTDALEEALGRAASGVEFKGGYGWRSGRSAVFPALADRLAGAYDEPAPALRILGQPLLADCADDLLTELALREVTLTGLAPAMGISFLCAYDRRQMSRQTFDDALAAHGQETDIDALVRDRLWRRPLAPPLGRVVDVVQARVHPAGARRLIVHLAADAGLDAPRAQDLGHAVHEVITNAVLYAHPPRVRFWTEYDRLVWEVSDRGPGISDPFAGYRPPDPLYRFGRGLWVARRLVDLLQIRSSPAGTTVRLHALL